MDAERLLISKVLETADLGPAAEAGITKAWFADPESARVWSLISDHKTTYGNVPTLEVVRQDWPTYRLLETEEGLPYLIDEMRRHQQYLIQEAGITDAALFLKEGRVDEVTERLQQALTDLSRTQVATSDINLAANGDERLAHYTMLSELDGQLRGIPSGFPFIDHALQGSESGQLITFVGPPKTGKAQPHSTPVLTPTGWRKLGELVPGDYVIGSDGQPVKVLGVHERGFREVFRVTLDDATSTLACGDHLWTVRPKGLTQRTVDTHVLRENVQRNKRYGMLPVVQSIEFSRSVELPLDPYLLGALIGDGGLTNVTPIITNPDTEIIERVRTSLPSGAVLNNFNEIHYRITGDGSKGGNPVINSLRELGLHGLGSHEKFIPDPYKFAAANARKQLLAGLLDTDGGMEGNSVRYCTTSQQLAEDVRDLVLSLGGCARVKIKQPYFRTKEGERKPGKRAYILAIRLPYGNPFYLSRKAKKFDQHCMNMRPPTRRVVSVEPAGVENVRCITVANADGLYVTENFIVTHNSTSMLLMAKAANEAGYEPLFIGFEMSNREQYERLDAIRAKISHARLRNGSLTPKEWRSLNRAIKAQSLLPDFHMTQDAKSVMTLTGLRTKIEKINPDIVFIDGVYLMQDENGEPGRSAAALSNITSGLKIMAQQIEKPVVIATQALESKMQGKKMSTYSIGYSSTFLQDSDAIIGAEQTDDKNVTCLKILAARNAPTGEAYYEWNWDPVSFRELEGNPFKNDIEVDEEKARKYDW